MTLGKYIALCACISILSATGAYASDEATLQLLAAADSGNVAAAESAIADGARIDEARREFAGADRQPPLVAAALRGHSVLVRSLLESGADPLAVEKDGYNVWHAAAFQGRLDVLKVLIERKTPGYGLHEDGLSPLHRACWGRRSRHTRAVKLLIEEGERDCGEPSADGRTPLQIARNPRTKAFLRNCDTTAASIDSPKGLPVEVELEKTE